MNNKNQRGQVVDDIRPSCFPFSLFPFFLSSFEKSIHPTRYFREGSSHNGLRTLFRQHNYFQTTALDRPRSQPFQTSLSSICRRSSLSLLPRSIEQIWSIFYLITFSIRFKRPLFPHHHINWTNVALQGIFPQPISTHHQ